MTNVERIDTPVGALPCAYGMGALILLEQKTGKKFGAISRELQSGEVSLELTTTLIWAGFENGARKQKSKFAYTEMDVADWLDEHPELTTKCFDLLTATMAPKSDTDEGNGQAAMPPKKK
jgi:hypothetical protein